MNERKKFVFLFHARARFQEEMALIWPPLRHVPERVYEKISSKLTVPSLPFSTVFMPDRPHEPAGYMVIVPMSSRQMMKQLDDARAKIDAAIDRAQVLGATVAGLGALTAPVTRGGRMLEHRQDVAITNGNAFTAAMTYEAIVRLLTGLTQRDPVVALVGATGSVGNCVARLLAKHHTARRLLLVARTRSRLDALAADLGRDGADVTVSTEMSSVRQADLVVLLTAATEALLDSSHLKPGAVVLDDTQPRNTDPRLRSSRPDVRILDGGLVSIPGLHLTTSIGLPHGHVFACLAETMLLALDGREKHFCLGDASVEQAEHTMELARKYRHFGFTLAPFRSFGRRIGADISVPGERSYAA